MRIRLRYFAMAREIMGKGADEREVDAGETAGSLFDTIAGESVRLGAMKGSVLLMVNQHYVAPEYELADGDELALIPPVSGGSIGAWPANRFVVSDAVLDPRAVESLVESPAAGAIVTFTGTVRDNARGKHVVALDYEAYPEAAEKMLAQIGEEIEERWGTDRTAISHRTGYLKPGEASVVIAVASPHRGEAFAACAYAIERIKQIVPIWKKEHYTDGAIWVGSEADYQRELRDSDLGR